MFGKCVPTYTNKITIRGLDTISISPVSQDGVKCTEIDAVLNNKEKDVHCGSERGSLYRSDKKSRPFFTDFYGELVHKRLTPEMGCENYLDYEEFTFMFVDEILDTAVDVISRRYKKSVRFDQRRKSSSRNILNWPTINNFNVTLGAAKIKEYIDCTSEMTEDWSYSVELLTKQSNNVSDFYKFEAKFGIPTQCFPVAQATASVYFTYEVSRVKPRHCPVYITYQVETCSCVMIPGRNYITEKMLLRVIDSKIAYFKRVESEHLL